MKPALGGRSGNGLVSEVAQGSFADRLDLQARDELLAVNGHQVQDVIDVRYYASEPWIRLRFRRAGRVRLREGERRYEEPLGLTFEEPIFDGIRACNNHCEFCFVAQMPKGMRRSLYVRDDDYRLSFLHGSYVTLTNLSEADWQRIEEQHLSPLYVSVHATENNLRRQLLGNPDAPDVMGQLRRLAALDVTVHTQVVVRPTVNDGRHLNRSIEDLAGLYPAVRSVSIVPVGLTKYHRFDCRLQTDAEMKTVLDQASKWQTRSREQLGVTFVYLSDEWYLRLGEGVPNRADYDGLDLTENGVGLVRRFLDEERRQMTSLISEHNAPTLVTGTLFAPTLRDAVVGSGAEVVSVVNRYLGESITVAGLLTVEDVIAQLVDRDSGDPVVLPVAMFGGPEGQSLDNAWPTDAEDALGRPVFVRFSQ